MLKLTVILLLLIGSISRSDGRARRQRRGAWPDILAPGGNTFAASGYYNMQSYIAYPETGFAFNPNLQGWNPYAQGYYPTNQFNNLNPYGYNQQFPYGSGQNVFNGGFPNGGQGNYNGYYPNPIDNNQWFPPSNNVIGPMRSAAVGPREGGYVGVPSLVQRLRRSVSAARGPTNK